MINLRQIIFAACISTCSISAESWAEDVEAPRIYNYSCKSGEVAGLRFSAGDWNVTHFKTPKDFYLSVRVFMDGYELATITQDSERKCKGNSSLDPFTIALLGGHLSCFDSVGQAIFFSQQRMRGGIANLYGSTDLEEKRDDLAVYPFICVLVK